VFAFTRFALLAALLTLPACRGAAPALTSDLEYRVDAEVVRNLGWVAPQSSDDEAAAEVFERIKARLLLLQQGEPKLGDLTLGHVDGTRIVVSTVLSAVEFAHLDRALRGMGALELLILAGEGDAPASGPELMTAEWSTAGFASGSREGAQLLLLPTRLQDSFTVGDFARVTASVDSQGFPALAFEFTDDRKDDFRDFTRRHSG